MTITIEEIKQLIPHRYPMLLIDKVREYNFNESCVGVKNVSINEEFFLGHFPAAPVMPGVLIVEAMAQTACVLACKSMNIQASTSPVFFTTIERVKFRAPVVPGDTLYLHVNKTKARANMWFFCGKAYVEEKLVCEAEFSAIIPKIPQ